MNWSSLLTVKKPGFRGYTAFSLVLSLIFLQEGFTYYLSFQVLALVTVAALVVLATSVLKVKIHFFVAFTAFAFSLAITAAVSPSVVSSNSSNMFVTVLGILGYSLMIACLPNLKITRFAMVLHVLRTVSARTIYVLIGLMLVSESGLIPFMNREAMTVQNSRLIDNFTDADALSANTAFRLLIDESARIDLFYGEPSFLAIVLFASLGCFILSSKLLEDAWERGVDANAKLGGGRMYTLTILAGVMSLLYIESLSSIIYALIVIFFAFVKQKLNRGNVLPTMFLLLIISVAFSVFSYKYFLFRLTQSDSLSWFQRFGFITEIGIGDLLMGLKDETKSPEVGIHNGLFYILSISGVGGIAYLSSLFYSVSKLSKPVKLRGFLVLLVSSIIMQNGGIFSPNKVALLSLVLLPLSCARSIYSVPAANA